MKFWRSFPQVTCCSPLTKSLNSCLTYSSWQPACTGIISGRIHEEITGNQLTQIQSHVLDSASGDVLTCASRGSFCSAHSCSVSAQAGRPRSTWRCQVACFDEIFYVLFVRLKSIYMFMQPYRFRFGNILNTVNRNSCSVCPRPKCLVVS